MIQGRFVSEIKEINIVEDIFNKTGVYLGKKEILLCQSNYIRALVYEGMENQFPAAAGSMILAEDEARIMAVAVLSEYRGKSYGEFLIRMLIDKAKTSGIQKITLSCEERMADYFQKYGFRPAGKNCAFDEKVCINMIYAAIDGQCCSKSI